MNKLKRIFAALVAAAMVMTSSGCGGTQTSLSPDESSSLSESVTSSVDTQPSATTVSTENAPQATVPPQEESKPVSTESKSESSLPVPDIPTTPSEDTSSAPTEEVPSTGGITVSCNSSNSWEESGKQCTQFDIIVKNGSGSNISGWTVKIDVGQAVEVMQCWNANAQGSGNTLTATNVEYNGEIANGSETSFGCIIKTNNKAQPVSVTVNGSSASVSVDTGSNGNTGNNTDSNNNTVNNNGSVTSSGDNNASSQPSAPPTSGDIEVTGRYGLVSDCGQLSVKGADLVDKNGTPVQLRGISTHGIQWFPAFANKSAFKHLRDEWNINVIRLAMYTGAGEGYNDGTKAGIEQTVQNAVDAAIELDMYVIIDWHVLQDQSPQVRKADSLRFFDYMSKKYAKYPNVIYEICNEPNGYASWSGDVKPYAEEVIPVIRKNDPDSVIIVGTPTWSQDIDKAMADPLKYDNIMYALHYYAATHTDWLRDRLKNCYNKGLPIMVTEFGNCDASGNGYNDWGQAKKWLELMDSLNISYMNWSLCDKAEAASLLKPGASSTGGWTDNELSENGKFMKDWFKNHS